MASDPKAQNANPQLVFYKEHGEYFLPLSELLFFETSGESVYAHTANDAFLVRKRLYELESFLPRQFVRVSKSCIVNTAQIYVLERKLPSSNLVRFAHTHKTIYVSRRYYTALRIQLETRVSDAKENPLSR